MRNRLCLLFFWYAAVIGFYADPLTDLIRRSLRQGYTSHAVLIPAIVIYLIWSNRATIFSSARFSVNKALQISAGAIVINVAAVVMRSHLGPITVSLLTVLSALVLLVAGFFATFGSTVLRQAVFPLSLLLFMVPIPTFAMDKIIHFLQSGSADLSAWMFSILGVPVLRDGFVLTVPGASIEVASECSGINSSIALLIMMLLIAHETLHTYWRRVLLVMLTIPLSIIKNAIRIVTLTMLATRVDPGFLSGRLHHQGGFVFFLISLTLVYPIWKILHKTERTHSAITTAEGVAVP